MWRLRSLVTRLTAVTAPDLPAGPRRATYLGDDALSRLLDGHPDAPDVAEARRRLTGIAAAAVDRDDPAWVDLLTPGASAELIGQLDALRRELAPPDQFAKDHADRLAAVRAGMVARGLAAFLVPRADEFQGEYVPPAGRRLEWLTGFTGSAGLAIVLRETAALFVDGRYTLQARDEVDPALFAAEGIADPTPFEWLAARVRAGDQIGVDPWLHVPDQLDRLTTTLAKVGARLVEVDSSPLDEAWIDRPVPPLGPIRPQPVPLSGADDEAKRRDIGAEIARAGADVAVIAAPDSIAWLLNLRGSDVGHTPLPLSRAIVDAEGAVELFVEPEKLTPEARQHLGNRVGVAPPAAFDAALARLGRTERRVLVDPSQAARAIFARLEAAGAKLVRGPDPCALPKARKNPTELAGTRAAHLRDGVAVTRFLAWLAMEAPRGPGEIEASNRLEAFRREGALFRDLSFPTISGAGPNGAIVHYRATPRTERRLASGELYLVDSGAQYQDGTTDVTRTVAIGVPDDEQRDRFTRVLKGHIAIATARFPVGTTGSQLDTLARTALWQVGLDYDHGTGHGVGSYLSVHEGPQRIAKSPVAVKLEPGMIVSNEPGYYKTGAWGIRIENLVVVQPIEIAGAERPMLGFETLTLAPIDRALIVPSLLASDEIAWLDAYHARVAAALTPLLDRPTAAWLAEATLPIAAS
jgi:Xaa-Pro aminopeptidase